MVPKCMETELVGDHDDKFSMDGIQNGFKIIDPPNLPVKINMKNYKSTIHNAESMESISNELREGRYMMTTKNHKLSARWDVCLSLMAISVSFMTFPVLLDQL